MTTPSASFGQYTITSVPQQIIYHGVSAGSVTVINQSATSSVYFTNNPVLSAQPDSAPLGPLGTITFDGTSDIYAFTLAGVSVVLSVLPSAIQSQSLFTGDTLIASVNNVQGSTGPGGTGILDSQVTNLDLLAYNTFELVIGGLWVDSSAAGAPLTGIIQLAWATDPAGTNVLMYETFEAWAGNSLPNTSPITLRGPCKARYLTIYVANQGTTGNLHIQSYVFSGSSRLTTRAIIYQECNANGLVVTSSGITFHHAASSVFEGISAALQSVALAANATIWIPLGVYNSTMQFYVNWSQALTKFFALASAHALVSGGPVSGTSAPGIIWAVSSAASPALTSPLINVPNCPLYAVVAMGATAGSIDLKAQVVT